MSEPWFRAKRYGNGAGLPMNWKGWVLLVAMIALIGALPYAAHHFVPPRFFIPATILGIAIITVPFTWIASRRTEGGPWRWRNGGQS
jgi:hypothetical protein